MDSSRTMPTTGRQAGDSASRGAAASPANDSSARMPAPANWWIRPARVSMSGESSVGKIAARSMQHAQTPNSTVGRPAIRTPAPAIPMSRPNTPSASRIDDVSNGARPPST
jgi:hypothetical protein